MAKSMLQAIAEAAGLDDVERPQPVAVHFRPAATLPAVPIKAPKAAAVFLQSVAPVIAATPRPAPVAEQSLPEQIIQAWKTDPTVRAEFGSLSTYAAWRKHDAAKAAGVSIAQIKAQSPDVSGYLAKHSDNLAPGERLAIEGYGATWRDSKDIRQEFGTFEVFAAYMRAKARGNGRSFGQ